MIKEFQGEFRFLSNFWSARIVYDGITYPTVEHAYQALKTLDIAERKRISLLATPGDAKKAGRQVKMRADWNQVKYNVMLHLVRLKFSIPELANKLLATGERELIEGNKWNDTYWGVCNGKGQNNLGKILMQVRKELRDV